MEKIYFETFFLERLLPQTVCLLLYSESTAQQLNFPLPFQDQKSFITSKQAIVQVSSSLPWGNIHFPVGTTLDSLSQAISMLYELPGSPHRNSEKHVERLCTNSTFKSKAQHSVGCLVLLLFRLEATFCPSLAPKTGAISKWCPLQMGTQLPTSFHIYPAKPASSTDVGLHFPRSSITLHIWQNIAYLAKKALSIVNNVNTKVIKVWKAILRACAQSLGTHMVCICTYGLGWKPFAVM